MHTSLVSLFMWSRDSGDVCRCWFCAYGRGKVAGSGRGSRVTAQACSLLGTFYCSSSLWIPRERSRFIDVDIKQVMARYFSHCSLYWIGWQSLMFYVDALRYVSVLSYVAWECSRLLQLLLKM